MSQEAAGTLLTVGQLVQRLRPYSPDITVSKLRFWERKGLISPRRTAGGHRLYGLADVERLSLILALRTHRLPLPTLQAVLRRFEEDSTYPLVVMERILSAEAFDPSFHPLSRAAASARAGLTQEQVTQLEELGLVVPCPKTDEFDAEAVQVLQIVANLLALGLTSQDLAFYARSIRQIVQYEHTLFSGLHRNGPGEAERMARYRRFRELIGPLQRLLYLSQVRMAIYALLGGSEKQVVSNP